MFSSALASIDALAAHLPFPLDEVDRAVAAFERWRLDGADDDLRTLDVWTYCWVRRYFLFKFMKNPGYRVSDYDALVADCFAKIQKKRETVKKPSLYGHWVNVVCKNTYLNYRRRQRTFVSTEEETMPELAAEDGAPPDPVGLRQLLVEAVDRLPDFLRETARLRLLEQRSYEEISALLDRPQPSLRAYVNKAMRRLREDPDLQTYFRDYQDG